MKRILILGKTGMLGHMVFTYFHNLSNKYEVFGTTRSELNIEKMTCTEIENKILEYNPEIIINCIGLINKYTLNNEYLAKKINSDFPHILANISKKHGLKIIQISTDCVCDNDIYGISKLNGEIKDNFNLTIRTSVIGPEIKDGFGLFHWFMTQKTTVNGFTKAMWDGVTTLELSKFIDFAICNNLSGLINYRTKNSISKYELLKLIAQIFYKNIPIIPDNREMKDKRELNSEYWCNKPYEQQLIELRNIMGLEYEMYNL